MKDSPEPSTVRGEPGSVAAPPMGTHHERVPVVIFEDSEAMARQVARHAAERIRERAAAGEPFVFGLPSGSTPIGVYEELVRLHQEEGLDFSNVVAFTLEEYYPIEPDSRQSCYRFVRENLLDHLNVPEEHIYVLRGNIPPEEVEAYCHRFQRATEDAGGFDLLILGIGRSGHIGFNEPGSDPEAGARLVVIDAITRKDAASIFFGEENVPRQGITLGVGTLLNSREIMLLATGEHKGPIVRRAVEEEPNVGVTASHLQHHPNTTFYLDRAAAGDLTRERTPWLVGTVDWDPVMAKRAVIWLSKKLDKAILTLEESDFYRNNLHDLVYAYGHVDHLCREVFEDLRHRIVYMEQLVSGEPVVVFSPHPDDDVISMGGMLDKLVANGNDVLVAYMTNGSVAVFDDDVRRYLQFLEFSRDVFWQGGAVGSDVVSRRAEILDFLDRKAPGEVDTEEVQAIKANIRYAEAVSAIGVMGLDVDHARFLDMTFYKTGARPEESDRAGGRAGRARSACGGPADPRLRRRRFVGPPWNAPLVLSGHRRGVAALQRAVRWTGGRGRRRGWQGDR